MRRSGSADLPPGAKLPATHAEAARGHKQQKRQRGLGVWDFYNRKLGTQPVLTKGLTCFFGKRGIRAVQDQIERKSSCRSYKSRTRSDEDSCIQ